MKAAKGICFVAVALLLVFLGGECAARAILRWQGKTPPHPDESVELEWRWAARHLAAGSALLPSDLVHDSLTGWTVRPSIDRFGLRTNREGMRGAAEIPRARVPGKRRVLFLGDSYTFGHEIGDDETYPHYLATRHLGGWEVLNMGVPGFGTDQQILRYESAGRGYGADVVVLGFFVRDYSRNLLRFRDYAKPRFLVDGAALRLDGSPVPSPEWLYAEYEEGRRRIAPWWRSRLLDGARAGLRAWGTRTIDEDAPGWRVLALLMERFATAVRADGATPVWLIIPSEESLADGDHRFAVLAELCARRARELALPCLSLAEGLRRSLHGTPPVQIHRDSSAGGHMAPSGNAVIAAEIARFFAEQGLLR
ncbi:MAG: SGNH/GDSL hydrolase family protein [Planctomycetes bacterium]|nr:SGNH/GDSL hydrolase family protein [Planctomycetota bacterium]